MKRSNYIVQLTYENCALKTKCSDLQNEILELKKRQEKLYLNHANFILFLQSRNIIFDKNTTDHNSDKISHTISS
jgi:hypothetical protein